MASFNASQVLRFVPGLTYRQLDTWTSNGWVAVSSGGKKTGDPRWYDAGEIDVIAMIHQLTQLGFRAGDAAVIARELAGDTPLTYTKLTNLLEITIKRRTDDDDAT